MKANYPMKKLKLCQRWRDHRASYRPEGEPIQVNRDGYFAEVIPKKVAKEFVNKHHYSGSCPPPRVTVGLFRDNDWGLHDLVGVAAYTVPNNENVIPHWLNMDKTEGIDLGRFVLHETVPANGETWFLSQSFKLLEQELPELKAVMATSDPIVRFNAHGDVVMPGHVGTIYQAHNGRCIGRTSSKTKKMAPNGVIITDRTLCKLKNGERGNDYVKRMLNKYIGGKHADETWKQYVARAETSFTKVKHPGNHVYCWAIGDEKKRTRRTFKDALPFPKTVELPNEA